MKKDLGETVTLQTYRRSCGFFGKVGERYLIYAYKLSDNSGLTTNGCTRTRYLANADEDLKEFEEKGEKPLKVYR